ncbi:MAG: GNAT family N-acetyltransferase [Desulfobacteraceae bacterium]|nr:GNAT family N-acetyltransferase [Desulfobacteraceae bacterium]
MIIVRPERVADKTEIQNVKASATATLRQTYRPKQRAIDNKDKIRGCLQRVVAAANGRVVGTVQYSLESQIVRITGLGVHTDYRQKGIARNLIRHLEKISIEKKVNQLKLHTVKETGNVDVFRRLGFTVVAERESNFFESDRFDKLTEVEMIMRLPVFCSAIHPGNKLPGILTG